VHEKIENDFSMHSTYFSKGDAISTVGINGDFFTGFNIAGANEYLLALKILIALFVILFVVWKLHLLRISRY
jgi:hypothetical protein